MGGRMARWNLNLCIGSTAALAWKLERLNVGLTTKGIFLKPFIQNHPNGERYLLRSLLWENQTRKVESSTGTEMKLPKLLLRGAFLSDPALHIMPFHSESLGCNCLGIPVESSLRPRPIQLRPCVLQPGSEMKRSLGGFL